MPLELFIALRYLLARRKQAFISVISLISTLGVAVGVMALVIALALMTGLQGEMRDRLLASTAHVYVWKTTGLDDYQSEIAKIQAIEGVVGAGPAIIGMAIVESGKAQTFANIKGIDPLLEPNVTDIEKTMLRGSVKGLLRGDTDTDPPGILLGKDLAAKLGVEVGDAVILLTQHGTLTPMGMRPGQRQARVEGIYTLGLLEFDSQWAFVSLDFATRLTGAAEPALIQVRVADAFEAPEIAERIVSRLGAGYDAQDWQDLNQSLFSALWMEKMVVSITIALIVMVAALQIVASLILMVMEKSRDIAILKTMGTSAQRISLIFMMQGLVIGVIGTTIGGTLSLALCWVLDTYKLVRIPMDVYQVQYIPFIVQPRDFAIVVVSAIVICFLATIYPSRQAARLDPVQALRFE